MLSLLQCKSVISKRFARSFHINVLDRNNCYTKTNSFKFQFITENKVGADYSSVGKQYP